MADSALRNPYRYLLVGSGWRSGVYLRLGTQYPDRLQALGVVSHTQARADQVAETWKLPTGTDVAAAVKKLKPDFVVVLLPWDIAPKVTEQVVELGVPVLCETPPALDLEGLKWVWEAVGSSNMVQSAEQYLRYPGHVARRKVIESGLIGKVHAVHVSQSHMYHEFSIIRHFLGVDMSPVLVNAFNTEVPMVEPQDYGLWIDEGSGEPIPDKPLVDQFAHLAFEAGGFGTYDFTERQWWNPLRVNRLVANASRGQLLDDEVTWLENNRRVLQAPLYHRYGGDEMTFEPRELDHIAFGREVLWTNQWIGHNLTDDDIAVADQLEAMGKWVNGDGPDPYPMAQACQDHAITLAVEESVATGKPVRVAGLPWM
jgi:predicted dehydrogenase